MAQYYSLAYIMKTTEDVQPTFSYTPGNTGDVMLAKGPKGGFIRDANINYDIDTDILGITGQVRTERVLFDNSGVRVGIDAGLTDQSGNAIAIGYQSGKTGQEPNSIAIGALAGLTDQSGNAVAIGYEAGNGTQGGDSIAIGYRAGYSNQAENTIILNATGDALNSVGDASACYVKPIRTVDTSYNTYEPLAYNKTTGELVSGNNVGFKMITDSFSVSGGGGSGASSGGDDKLFAYSYDGITWEQDDSSKAVRTFTDGSCNAIGYDGTVWVAGGVGESAIVHSVNGITWERNDDNSRSVLDSGNWRNAVDISCDLVGSGEIFGSSVGLDQSGNVMAVGAYGYNSNEGNVSLYDYSMNSDSWVKTYDLSSNVAGESFGTALAMSRIDATTTRIAIGAPTNNTADGKVYVYDTSYNEDTWGDRTIYLVDAAIDNIGANEKFGSAIAMNALGTRLLIGAPEYNSGIGAVYNFDLSDNVWIRHPTSNIFDGTSGNFGHSIAINAAGTRCLIGEPNLINGRVYGYDFSANSGYWGLTSSTSDFVYDQDLSYNPTVVDASFGHVISMNDAGDWCAVGAPTAGSGRGWVGIYNYNYRGWGLYTDISGETVFDKFGSSVAMNGAGNRLIIGAKGSGSGIGNNYVYNYNSETLAWEFERTVSSGAVGSSIQGETLAIDTLGNRFVSGAPSHDTNNGTIAVYDRQMKCNALTAHGGNWIAGGNAVRVEEDTPFAYSADGITNWQAAAKGKEQAILRKELCYAPTGTNNYFGSRCDMNAAGTRLVVGSPAATVGGDVWKGRVCIYDYDMSLNDWISEPTKVYEEGQGTNHRFGSDVALNAAGDILVVGYSSYDDGGNFNYGRVYIYHYDYSNDQWPDSPTRWYVGDAIDNDLGYSVVINARGDRIAVGAPTDDTGGTNAGAVFIIDYDHAAGVWPGSDGTAASSIPGRIKTHSGAANYFSGTSLSFNAAGDVLAIGVPFPSNSEGYVDIIERDNTTGQWGRLTSPIFTATTFALAGGATSYGFTNTSNSFGWKVSLNAKGDRLAVSNYNYATNDPLIGGRVYIIDYDYDKKTWPSTSDNVDALPINSVYTSALYGQFAEIDVSYNCGYSLKLNAAGDRLLIGETANNVYGTNRGALHVIDYNKETGQWPTAGPPTNVATYSFYGTNNEDYFGGSCAMNALGNRIAVGASMFGVFNELDDVTNASDKYGTDNGYVRLYDLLTLPIQLEDCRALTTFNGNLIAGGKGNGGHIFALSDDNGVTWKNNQMNEDRLFKYDWSGNPLTFPYDKVSNFTHEFFGDANFSGQGFGSTCTINYDGTRCVISSKYHTDYKGALFFFHNDDGYGWKLNTQFINPEYTYGGFGQDNRLSINDAGTRVITGAVGKIYNLGINNGSLYIFDYYNGVWNYTKRIDGDAAEYMFGVSCAINAVGDRFIVGEVKITTHEKGSAHIYHLIDNDWRLMKTYSEGTDISGNIKFGHLVAINGIGDRVAVNHQTDGHVYIYDYVNGAWGANYSHRITNFSTSMDFNALGDRLILGYQNAGIGYGVAYILHYNDASRNWTLEREYNSTVVVGRFGHSVSMDASGDRVLISQIGDPNSAPSIGAAYLYSYDYGTGAWPATKLDYDVSFAGVSYNDQFGSAVALTGLGHKALISSFMWWNSKYGRGYLYDAVRSSETSDIYCNALAVKGSNEMIVAGLGGTGVSNPLVWSADGLTWYPSDNGGAIFTGSGAVCKAVTWNGSRWVAGGKSSGSGGPLAYSYNGKKWYKSMNGLALLGAASTCNAVSWNGKYWLASVEGATGGQTQVYSNDGITWLASNNGDELFGSTSQALALATVKDGNEINKINLESRATTLESRATTLESEVDTLQLTQFGVGQSWSGNLATLRTEGTTYYNNTDKLMFVNVTAAVGGDGFAGIIIYVDGTVVASNYDIEVGARTPVSFVVPAGSSYSWDQHPAAFTSSIERWYEFS